MLIAILVLILLVLLFGAVFVRELLAIGFGLLCLFVLFLFFFAMCGSPQENNRVHNTIDSKYNGMTADELQKKFIEEDKARRLEKEKISSEKANGE